MRVSPSGKAPFCQVGMREFDSRRPLQCLQYQPHRWYSPPTGGFFIPEVAMKIPRFRRKVDAWAFALMAAATLGVILVCDLLYIWLPRFGILDTTC